MLNKLLNAIRKKQLVVHVVISKKNINQLLNLLTYNIISGFSTMTKNKKKIIVVFLNYNFSMEPTITSKSFHFQHLSNCQTKILALDKFNNNMSVNINLTSMFDKTTGVVKPKNFFKFR